MNKTENEIGKIIVNAAFDIHRRLGVGLLESVYETVLSEQLKRQGLLVERQVPISIKFDVQCFENGFRADLIVNECVIVELKSVEALNRSHRKQLQTYLKLSGLKLGFLINFGDGYFKDAISRVVNGLEE